MLKIGSCSQFLHHGPWVLRAPRELKVSNVLIMNREEAKAV
jgi:hypothetical protein